MVIDSLIQLKKISEISQLIDSLLDKVSKNEGDSQLHSYIQAKIKVEEEDQHVVQQELDIDILDQILNDQSVDLDHVDIGLIYYDRVRKSQSANTLNKKDIYTLNNDLGNGCNMNNDQNMGNVNPNTNQNTNNQ